MDNAKIVQDAYAAFERGDVPAVLASCSADVQWMVPGDPELIPAAGRHEGVSGVATFFSTLAQTQDVESFEPRQFIAQGDTVIALGDYRWRIKKTGKTFASPFAHVFTVRDGKVVAFHEFSDTAVVRDAYTV
jgi:ketosteroid isomerase-like protein